MPEQSIILLVSKTKLTKDHQEHWLADHTSIFIRSVIWGGTVGQALDNAGKVMLKDEEVLNTIPY